MPRLPLCKNNASERNESLLADCRAKDVLCKNNPSERNESLLADCRAKDVLCKVSVFALYYKIWKVI